MGALTSVTALKVEHGVSPEWIGASVAMGAVGRADDIVGLPAAPRLSAQIATGAVVGARRGGLPGAIVGATVLPAIVNAFNFMDGINGISGGTAVVWGLTVAMDPSGEPAARTQGAVAAGMGMGFLPYNIPQASMFLGDVGSYLFGAGIATTVIQTAFRSGKFCSWDALPVIAPLAPYLADTSSTILKRIKRGDSIAQAHREHAYQRLLQETDWPHWMVSSLVAGAAAACGAAGRSSTSSIAIGPILVGYLASPWVASRI